MAVCLSICAVEMYRVRHELLEEDYGALFSFNKVNVEWPREHFSLEHVRGSAC